MTVALRALLTAVVPTFGLAVRCGDLELKVPDDADLVALADVAATGVHHADAAFTWPWTRGGPDRVRRNVLEHHWSLRSCAELNYWRLGLGIYRAERIVGIQSMVARDFPVLRSATTGSWVGASFHGHGIGTKARHMVLHLAFEGLGAREMVSEADTDNAASNAVSAKLGYELGGERLVARDGKPAVRQRWRLTREAWDARPDQLRPDVRLHGVTPVLEHLGISS
ncbi:GNAT family N-acetyltransferase [Antribacter sp. KLBMP9083]|uniref:GNAT family N-acetyltransferase n=1 Tax=Antribacter soli TaxID=2910976 RepID=A0AA41QGH6_9MICO|nr:GNAT family protein [Antribacter soli]MCF4123040.1 GNAT family N-acetyltransferase [Antribacter soli]